MNNKIKQKVSLNSVAYFMFSFFVVGGFHSNSTFVRKRNVNLNNEKLNLKNTFLFQGKESNQTMRLFLS